MQRTPTSKGLALGAGLWLWVSCFPWAAGADSHHTPVSGMKLGKRIYIERCKACHGPAGNGQTFAANVLDPPPRDFTSAQSRRQLTRRRMIRSVTEGRPGTAMMPWKKILSQQEIAAVVTYVRRRLMGLEHHE